MNNIGKETARLKALASAALTSSSAALTSSSSATGKTTPVTDKTTGSLVRPANSKTPSLMRTLTDANIESINSIKQTTEIQPVDIPGFTFDPNAVSVKSGVRPVSASPRTKSEASVRASLWQEPGNETRINNTEF